MSFTGKIFKIYIERLTHKLTDKTTAPNGVEVHCNIDYVGDGDRFHLLDVYYPQGTNISLPTIVNVHGGGFVSGTKETYKNYCMYLATKGFCVVNFNYSYAPIRQFPAAMEEINQVLVWLRDHADAFFADTSNVFFTGDSAGAQMAYQYLTAYSNPAYAELFGFDIPKDVVVRAVGLNCGLYSLHEAISPDNRYHFINKGFMGDYLGKNPQQRLGKLLDIEDFATSDFPPAFIATAYYDFLHDKAKPLYLLLTSRGVEAELHDYGTKADKHLTHIFHVNFNYKESEQMNTEECDFFRNHIK